MMLRTFSSHIKADDSIRNKADELDKLHCAMKEKLQVVSFSEKIQTLTLVPDSWSRAYCSTYFNVSEYLIRTAHDLKETRNLS